MEHNLGSSLGLMAPKAKAKAKVRAKAKAKAVAAAKAAVRRRGALRRPAGHPPPLVVPPVDPTMDWRDGRTVQLNALALEELQANMHVVIEEANYFHSKIKGAGTLKDLSWEGPETCLKLEPTGTNNDQLLKHCSGRHGHLLRVIRCGPGCGHESVADDLIHGGLIRKGKRQTDEEGWAYNLVEVSPGLDELDRLRARQDVLAPLKPGAVLEGDKKAKSSSSSSSRKKKSKKSKKKKGKKKDSKKDKKEADPVQEKKDTVDEIPLDGTKPKKANQKQAYHLYAGTGVDARERVRHRVARRARRAMAKRGDKASSSTGSSSSSSVEEVGAQSTGEETLFQQMTKVKFYEDYPGALANQAVVYMRQALLQELGSEDQSGSLKAVATLYYRQVLKGKCSGPVGREAQTLALIIDQLLRCRPASALDAAVQRLKSIESTLNGSHWAVSQRLEVLPNENLSMTAEPELSEAQKTVYNEAKLRNLASYPDNRRGGKGKTKGEGKDDRKGQQDGKGKNKGQKTEGAKK